MCGITAYVARERPVSLEGFHRSVAALHHRGPDGNGIWVNPTQTVALGHTRLAIVDPEGGQQPLCNEDQSIWAVVNGELYDDARLRAELEAAGHRFATRSDSELLVHLYERYGARCVHFLRGEFAAVLWDANNRVLLAVRDRFGIKPLVYHRTAERIVLASEAKALFAMGEVEPAWDLRSVHDATTLQYVPPNRTFFAGVEMLEPGHMLVWSEGQARISKYWDLYQSPLDPRPRSPEDIAEEFEARFAEAVRLRLRADVPVAFYLSGGIDSSAVAGFAKQAGVVSSYYTVTFDESIDRENYNEEQFARATVEMLGGEFRPVRVSRRELVDALSDAVWFSEGTSINAHLPAKYLLSQRVRADGYRVVLTGEGADELLLGYPHLRDDYLSTGGGDAQQRAALQAAHTVSMGVMLDDGLPVDLAALEGRLGHVPSFVRAKAGFGLRFAPLLDRTFAHEQASVDSFAMLADLLPEHPAHPLPAVLRSAYLWTKLCLANYILKVLGDGTEMAHSVEGRVPFLDHQFAEFIFGLPLASLLAAGQEKPILRSIARGKTVEQVRTRNKHPFLTPHLYTQSDPHTREWFADLLGSHCPPFLDADALARFLTIDRPEAERSKYDPIYLTVACLCALQQRFNPAAHKGSHS
jgi:asparagine synthase (glutamine-hydrolysing)